MRNPKHVSSYPPEYLHLLLTAAEKPVEFTLPWKVAYTRRAELHSFRAALRREEHHAAEMVQVVEISIRPSKKPEDPTKPAVMRLAPRSADFSQMIKQELGTNNPTYQPVAETPTRPEEPETTSGEFDYTSIFNED